MPTVAHNTFNTDLFTKLQKDSLITYDQTQICVFLEPARETFPFIQ